MIKPDVVKVSSRGMVTIPRHIREKFKISEGTSVAFFEQEGQIILVPLLDMDDLRQYLPSRKEMLEELENSRDVELKLEE